MVQLKTIKGFDNFSSIYQAGKKFRSKSLSATVVFNTTIEQNEHLSKILENTNVYFAVVVGKKISKKAVIRNRIKRLMRESLRIIDCPTSFFCVNKIIFSCFVAPLHPKLITLKEIMPAVKDILEQANLFYNKQHNFSKTN